MKILMKSHYHKGKSWLAADIAFKKMNEWMNDRSSPR